MACGGPDDEFYFSPSGSRATSVRDEARLPTGSEEADRHPRRGPHYDILGEYYNSKERAEEYSQEIQRRQNDIQWMKLWLTDNCTAMINYKFSEHALKYLCQNYASNEQKQELIDNNWNIGFMFAFIEILLRNCQRLSKVCNHGKEMKSAYGTPKESAYRTPKESAYRTPKESAYRTPKESARTRSFRQREVERSLPYRTPKDSIHTPLFQQTEVERSVSYQAPQGSRIITPKSTPRLISQKFRRFGVRSLFQKKYTEQRFDETPQRQRTLFSSPTSPFETPTPFTRTIALSSPKREEPVLVNIAVDPKPLIDTARGERFVCDVAINIQPGGSGMLPQMPQTSASAIPFQRDTPTNTNRGRISEMNDSPVINRGPSGQYNTTSTSSGFFTPRAHKSPRRRNIPGSQTIHPQYDPSIVNVANILEDRQPSSARRTTRLLYDPSILNEANILDDRHSSPGRRTPRSPYDPSIVNEANFLDDRYSSPGRRTPIPPYDPSIVNEANILDDYPSEDRTNLESE